MNWRRSEISVGASKNSCFPLIRQWLLGRISSPRTAEFFELGGMRVVIEGAGDQHVEVRIRGFAGGGARVGAGDGSKLRADEDAGALLRCDFPFAFELSALRANVM